MTGMRRPRAGRRRQRRAAGPALDHLELRIELLQTIADLRGLVHLTRGELDATIAHAQTLDALLQQLERLRAIRPCVPLIQT